MDLIEIFLLKYLNQNKLEKEELYRNKIFERISILINSIHDLEIIFCKKSNLIMFFWIYPKIKTEYKKLLKLLFKKFIYNQNFIKSLYEIYEYFSQSEDIKSFFKINDWYPGIELMKKDLTKILINFDLKTSLIDLFEEIKLNFLKLFFKLFYNTKKKFPNYIKAIDFSNFEKIFLNYLHFSRTNILKIFYKYLENLNYFIDNKVIFIHLFYSIEDFILEKKKHQLDVIYFNEIKTKFQKNTIYNIRSKHTLNLKNTFKDDKFCTKNYIVILSSIKDFTYKNNIDYLIINSDIKSFIKINKTIKKFFTSKNNIDFLLNYFLNTYDIDLNENLYWDIIFDSSANINNFKDFLPLSFIENPKFKKYIYLKPKIMYIKSMRSMKLIKMIFKDLIFQEISKINNNFIIFFLEFLINKISYNNFKKAFFDYNIFGYLLYKIIKISFISIEKIISHNLIILCLDNICFEYCQLFIYEILSLKIKNKMVYFSEIKTEILNYLRNINFLDILINKLKFNSDIDYSSLPNTSKKDIFELIISNNKQEYYENNINNNNNIFNLNSRTENKLWFYDVDKINILINLEDVSFLSSSSNYNSEDESDTSKFINEFEQNTTFFFNKKPNNNIKLISKLGFTVNKNIRKLKSYIEKIIDINNNKNIFEFTYMQNSYTYNNCKLENDAKLKKNIIKIKNKKNLCFIIDSYKEFINENIISSLYPFDNIYPNKWFELKNKENNFEVEKEEQLYMNSFSILDNLIKDIIFYGKIKYINNDTIDIFPYKFKINIKDLIYTIFENYYNNILEICLHHFFKYITILFNKNYNSSYIALNIVCNIIEYYNKDTHILSIYKTVLVNKLNENLEYVIRLFINLFAIKYSELIKFPWILYYIEKLLFIIDEIISNDVKNRYKIVKKIPFMVFEMLIILLSNEKSLLILNFCIKIIEKILCGKSMRYKKFILYQMNLLGNIHNILHNLITNLTIFDTNIIILLKNFIENNYDKFKELIDCKNILNKIIKVFDMIENN